MKMKLAGAIDCESAVGKGVRRVHGDLCNGSDTMDSRELSYVFNNCFLYFLYCMKGRRVEEDDKAYEADEDDK